LVFLVTGITLPEGVRELGAKKDIRTYGIKEQRIGKKYVVRSIVACTPQQMLYG
jgi:hypothetical protein